MTLENSQGTLDPLGLYSIADRLASRLAPDLRERMKHPRYLTAIAVGAIICSDITEEMVAVDEVSASWQVYEWYVVSAFVKKFQKEDPDQLIGMPGREKTTHALRDDFRLSAIRYLKTPSVFGFHGVYRTLAKGIKLIDGVQIGEFGLKLVDAWEKEQGLDGFRVGIKGSPGYYFRNRMRDAILEGLKLGAVSKGWNWDFYQNIATCLAPKNPGENEKKLLFEQLLSGESDSRAEIINYIISKEGQTIIQSGSEKTLQTEFLKKKPNNESLILAIQAYEKIARLLYNAFYATLTWMQDHQCKGGLEQLVKLDYVKQACEDLPIAFAEADRLLEPFTEESYKFSIDFRLLRENFSPKEWLRLLFEHHIKVQKSKPPTGKASWVLEHSSGNYLLNTTQAGKQNLSQEYVHQYRMYSLQSFMKDLGKI